MTKRMARDDILAEHYLRAAGIAAVWIDADGHLGAQDVVSVAIKPGRIVYCCKRGTHFVLAYRLYEWKKAIEADSPATAAKLDELAERGGVGLTSRAVALCRATAAIDIVNQSIERMAAAGELLDLKAAFKAARKLDPVRYGHYFDARKAAMLETLAQGNG